MSDQPNYKRVAFVRSPGGVLAVFVDEHDPETGQKFLVIDGDNRYYETLEFIRRLPVATTDEAAPVFTALIQMGYQPTLAPKI